MPGFGSIQSVPGHFILRFSVFVKFCSTLQPVDDLLYLPTLEFSKGPLGSKYQRSEPASCLVGSILVQVHFGSVWTGFDRPQVPFFGATCLFNLRINSCTWGFGRFLDPTPLRLQKTGHLKVVFINNWWNEFLKKKKKKKSGKKFSGHLYIIEYLTLITLYAECCLLQESKKHIF